MVQYAGGVSGRRGRGNSWSPVRGGSKAQLPCGIIKNPIVSPFIQIERNSLKNRSIKTSALLLLSLSLTHTHTGMSPARSLRGVWVASVAMELILYRSVSVVMVTRVCPGSTASTYKATFDHDQQGLQTHAEYAADAITKLK